MFSLSRPTDRPRRAEIIDLRGDPRAAVLSAIACGQSVHLFFSRLQTSRPEDYEDLRDMYEARIRETRLDPVEVCRRVIWE
jgi:hypothetical protein